MTGGPGFEPGLAAQQYAAQIDAATGGHELNTIAARGAVDPDITPKEKAWLNIRFDLRCRDLYAHAYRRSRRSA